MTCGLTDWAGHVQHRHGDLQWTARSTQDILPVTWEHTCVYNNIAAYSVFVSFSLLAQWLWQGSEASHMTYWCTLTRSVTSHMYDWTSLTTRGLIRCVVMTTNDSTLTVSFWWQLYVSCKVIFRKFSWIMTLVIAKEIRWYPFEMFRLCSCGCVCLICPHCMWHDSTSLTTPAVPV